MTEQMAIEVLKMIEAHGGLAINAKDVAIQALEEIQQYRAIGTVEELQALKEKSVAKSRNLIEGRYYCPRCGIRVEKGYCNECGQLNY